ncbi:hypothetical protein ACPWSR_01955 [Alloiococcus sp. CFN-8]|uniref:hypothetical protein n=1 Tax=Alloiococcus sp. CFN-8 TaxID=3416081 RepID=UPI003CF002A7
MSNTEELLNYVYKNSQMGVNTIEQLSGIVEDQEFKKHLDSQLREYRQINEESQKLLDRLGYEEEGVGALSEISAYMMINFKTLRDKSPSHIAEMMINGSTMGIIQATRNLRKYKNEDKEFLALMEKLLKTEENNFQQLKKFL